MLTQMYGVIIVAIIVVWGAVIIKYNSEKRNIKHPAMENSIIITLSIFWEIKEPEENTEHLNS